VHLRLLWPFPVDEVMAALQGATPLVGVELNYTGQLARLLREQTGLRVDHLVVKYNGRPISSRELEAALRSIHSGEAEAKLVIRNPLE
jgi:2-oxoglutarate ferredoxin oxidoreductase subunit alpha